MTRDISLTTTGESKAQSGDVTCLRSLADEGQDEDSLSADSDALVLSLALTV